LTNFGGILSVTIFLDNIQHRAISLQRMTSERKNVEMAFRHLRYWKARSGLPISVNWTIFR